MTRMTKEFSLVLLGSSLLTAGSFVWPGEDLERNANRAAAQQVGAAGHAGGSHTTTHGRHFVPIFIHTPRYAGGGASAAPTVARSGFGSTGRSFFGAGG